MKRSLLLSLSVLLVGSSVALASTDLSRDEYQESAARPRRVDLPNTSFLGVDLGEVSRETVERLGLREERGALITHVVTGSSAAKAGLQKDDVIVKWNEDRIESALQVSRRIRETPAGRTVRIGFVRNGRESEVEVKLGDRTDYLSQMRGEIRSHVQTDITERVRPARVPRMRMSERYYRMGVSLQSMSPQLAEYFGLPNRNGALVLFVYADSPAAKAGIKAGDVILSIGGATTENPGQIHEVLRTRSEGPVEVKVMRDRQERSFTVQLEKAEATTGLLFPDESDDVLAPVVIPRIAVRIPQVAVEVPRIAPLPRMRFRNLVPAVAPVAIPRITVPRMVMPRITVPRVTIPPIRIFIPFRYYSNPV